MHKVIEILRDELSTCMALSGIFITVLLHFKYTESGIIMSSIPALYYDSFTVFIVHYPGRLIYYNINVLFVVANIFI